MLGIFFYGALAFGLGLLLPLGKDDEHGTIGLRFVGGSALLILTLYATAVVMALPLGAAVGLVSAIAALGWVRCAQSFRHLDHAEVALHPAVILPAAAASVAAAYGRVDYVPYLIDEFTNWIGASRIIHWAGSYEAVRETLYLGGYTPGWRLLLLAPWQASGDIDHGLSAAATLTLHVGTLALLYDIVVLALRRDAAMPATVARGSAWLILLVFLTAEGMGRLWTYEMLIEQPQIYILSAAALLILLAELTPGQWRRLYLLAGFVLAGGFLLKNAVLAAAPAALAVALVPCLTSSLPLFDRLRESAARALYLIVPMAVTMLSWNAIAPSDTCLSSPISVFISGKRELHEAADLARRYLTAVGVYVLQYKLLVTLAAAVGLVLGIHFRLFRAVLFGLAFTTTYLFALYWYHLDCFGSYYFQELNSIPRFTRVPIQMLHTLGLVLLAISAVRLGYPRVPELVSRRTTVVIVVCLMTGFAAWQVRQTHRTVADLTTRIHQNVDRRIAEMQRAASFVERHAGELLRPRPSIAIIGQGQDGDVRGYAEYFARRPADGGSIALFTVHAHTSWAPVPANAWQITAPAGALARELASLDLLWPIHVDPWLLSELRPLVPDEACLADVLQHALVHDRGSTEPRFFCRPKDS